MDAEGLEQPLPPIKPVLTPVAEVHKSDEKSFRLYTVISGYEENGELKNFKYVDAMVLKTTLKNEQGTELPKNENAEGRKFKNNKSPWLHELKPADFEKNNRLTHEIQVTGTFYDESGDCKNYTNQEPLVAKTIILNRNVKINLKPEVSSNKIVLHLTTEGQRESPVGNWYVTLSEIHPNGFKLTKTVNNKASATVEFSTNDIFSQIFKKNGRLDDFNSSSRDQQRKNLESRIQQSQKKLRIVFQGSNHVRTAYNTYNLNLYTSDLEKTFVKFADLLPKPPAYDPGPISSDPNSNPNSQPKPDPKPNPTPGPNPNPNPKPSPPNPQPTPRPIKVQLHAEACFDLIGNLVVHASLPEGKRLKGNWTADIGEERYSVKGKDRAIFKVDASKLRAEGGTFPLTIVYEAEKDGRRYRGKWNRQLVQIEVKGKPTVKDGKLTFQASLKGVRNVEDGAWKITYDGKTFEKEGNEQINVTLDPSSDRNNPQGTTDFETGKDIKIEFSGKVAEKEVEGCLKDTIQPVSENEDKKPVEKKEVKNQQAPHQRAGGQLPKTATAYGFNLWVGALLIFIGFSMLGLRRRFGR